MASWPLPPLWAPSLVWLPDYGHSSPPLFYTVSHISRVESNAPHVFDVGADQLICVVQSVQDPYPRRNRLQRTPHHPLRVAKTRHPRTQRTVLLPQYRPSLLLCTTRRALLPLRPPKQWICSQHVPLPLLRRPFSTTSQSERVFLLHLRVLYRPRHPPCLGRGDRRLRVQIVQGHVRCP